MKKSSCSSSFFYLLFFLLIFQFPVLAQNQVGGIYLSGSLIPPFTGRVENIPEKLMLNLRSQNFSIETMMLVFEIKGNNGILIKTKALRNTGEVFSIGNNEFKTIPKQDISTYFDAEDFTYAGTTAQAVFDKGLPEGSYSLCITAYDIIRNKDVTAQGGKLCLNFNIQDKEPVTTVQPACGSKVTPQPAQNVLFTWTPASGAPVWTRYRLHIVEMSNPKGSPEEAVRNKANIQLLDKELSSTTYIYGLSDIALIKGKTYAWEVVARDDETMTKFRNEGRSKACFFSYGEAPKELVVTKNVEVKEIITPKKEDKPGISIIQTNPDIETFFPGMFYSMATIKGKALYDFYDNIDQIYTEYDQVSGEETDILPNSMKPLKNMPLSLKVAYYIKKGNTLERIYESIGIPEAKNLQNNQVVSTTVSDGSGNYSFTFFLADSMGLVTQNADFYTGGGEFKTFYKGEIYRFFQIITEDKHYLSDQRNVLVQPGGITTFNLYSYLRTYKLKVNVSTHASQVNTYTNGPLHGMNVFILRKDRPINTPPEEGQPEIAAGEAAQLIFNGTYYDIVAKNVTNTSGDASFTHLIKNIGTSDLYYVYAQSVPGVEHNYYIPLQTFAFDLRNPEMTSGINIPCDDYIKFNGEYDPCFKQFSLKASAFAKKPEVYGNVIVDNKEQTTLPGVKVRLLNYAVFFATEEASTYSGSNGAYYFKNLASPNKVAGSSLEGPIRIVEVNEPGYNKVSKLLNNGVAIPDGLKVRQDISLKPDATISGKIINEEGAGVSCFVKVVGGSSVKADPYFQIEYGSQNDKSEKGSLSPVKDQAIPTLSAPNSPVKNTKATDIKVPNTKSQAKSTKSSYENIVTTAPVVKVVIPTSITVMPAAFEMAVPSGKRTIIFEPESNDYFTDTMEVDVKKGANDLGYITLKKKEHRLQVKVSDGGYPGSQIQLQTLPAVPGAKVSIVNITEDVLTDARGNAFLKFGGGNSFTIRIKSPDNADFQEMEIKANNIPISKDFQFIGVTLFRSAFLEGIVYDENGKPLKGASIKVKMDGPIPLEAVSDDKGAFKIKQVPPAKGIDVSASKEGLIGQVKKLDIPNTGLSGVIFTVRAFPEMDFTKLLGFPILVDSLIPKPDGAIISGRITDLPSNSLFAIDAADKSIAFKDVFIKPGTATNASGVPLAVPATLPVKTEVNSIQLKVNSTLFALQSDKGAGLQIIDLGGGVGALKGKIAMNTSESFQDVNLTFTDSLYLTDAAGVVAAITSITADGSAPFSAPIKLANAKGKDIQFKVYDFSAEAAKSGARIEGSKLILPTILHTNIGSLATPDLKLNIGELKVNKLSIEGVDGSAPINIALEQWKLSSDSWAFNDNGLKLSKGNLETHMANVPFSGIEIKPTSLESGTFDLSSLDLKGVATLKVTGNAVMLYENAHWKLSITAGSGLFAGYIENLPGLGSQVVKVKSSYLTSDKKGTFNLDFKPLKIYSMFDFYPNDLYFDASVLKVSGTIDLHAPNVPVKNTAMVWEKTSSGLTLGLQNFSFNFFTNGVNLSFVSDKESLKPTGFFCKGTLSEPGLYSMNVEYQRTVPGTSIISVPGAEMNIDATGQKKLINIDGKMTAGAGSWSNFIFSGDLTGTQGATGRLTFEIKGDIVASNESVDVQNIETPFGNLNVSFDFAKKRLTGHIDCDKEIEGTGTLKGTAEMVVDGNGWYLCAGGTITMKNNPYIKEANTAILFGNYPVAGEPFVQSTFATYSYTKTLPATFKNNIKGFFIDGSCTVPVPYVPDIDIDLVVVSAELWVHAGGDFSLGMDFGSGDVTVFTGLLAFIEAHVGLSGSIGIACAGCSGNVKLTLSTEGQISSSGAWYTKGKADLTMSCTAYAGGGCCDSDCDYLGFPCPSPCFSDDWSGSKSFGAEVYVGSDDNYINVSF